MYCIITRMCICIYGTHTCVYAHKHICVCVYIYMYIYTHTHTLYVHIKLCMHNIYEYMHTHIRGHLLFRYFLYIELAAEMNCSFSVLFIYLFLFMILGSHAYIRIRFSVLLFFLLNNTFLVDMMMNR